MADLGGLESKELYLNKVCSAHGAEKSFFSPLMLKKYVIKGKNPCLFLEMKKNK